MEQPEGAAPVQAVEQLCTPPPDSRGSAEPPRPNGSELVDKTLLEEITLLSEVIVRVSTYRTHLDTGEVDDVLGVNAPVPSS